MEIIQVRKATQGRASLFLVKQGNVEVGLLEKYNDTRTETHPWKAFIGVGVNSRYIGAHYGRNGKQAAIDQIFNGPHD